MSIVSCFSDHYTDAREKFLAACADRSLEVESLLNPNAKGSRDEDLYTDVVRLGRADASRVLVLSSGTHGVEGYCGSGAQVGFLTQGHLSDLPADLSIVMIHAMNPYGFSHDRRVNEDNVDLNRNFIDFAAAQTDDSAYTAIHAYLLPDDWDGPSKQAANQALVGFIEENGIKAFQAAVSGGQRTHADGIFYGGRKPTWSHEMIRSVLRKYAGGAQTVGVIDFHTGLGPYGYGELISDGPPAQKALTQQWYGDQVTDPDAGTSSSAPLTGTLGHGVATTLPDAKIAFIALEYGTYDINRVLGAVRGDNWLYLKGDVHSELGADIKQEIRDTFYPDKDDWKADVWSRACEVVDMAIEGAMRDG